MLLNQSRLRFDRPDAGFKAVPDDVNLINEIVFMMALSQLPFLRD